MHVKQFHQNVSLQPGSIQVEVSCKPNCDCHTTQHCHFPLSLQLTFEILCLSKTYMIPFLIKTKTKA